MAQITFSIITPERVVYEATVDAVSLPTQTGEITVLPHHVPLVSSLKAGEITVHVGGEKILVAIFGGFVQITDNKIVVLTENAERAEEIDEARAEAARARAVELMNSAKDREAVDYTVLAAKLERELTRLRVARKHAYRNNGGTKQ